MPHLVRGLRVLCLGRWSATGKRRVGLCRFGGAEERSYPWGQEAPDATRMRPTFLVDTLSPVGMHPAGRARWGQFDMVGGVVELNFDCFAFLVTSTKPTCPNSECACAGVEPFVPTRTMRGGGAADTPTFDYADQPQGWGDTSRLPGVRCARAPT